MFHCLPIPLLQYTAGGVNAFDNVLTIDNLAKTGIARTVAGVTTRPVRGNVILRIDVKTGAAVMVVKGTTGQPQGILVVRVVGGIFLKEHLVVSAIGKNVRERLFVGFPVVLIVPQFVRRGKVGYGFGQNHVRTIVMKGYLGLHEQPLFHLLQKHVRRVGHEFEGGQFDDNVPGIVFVGKPHFEFDAVRSRSVALQDPFFGLFLNPPLQGHHVGAIPTPTTLTLQFLKLALQLLIRPLFLLHLNLPFRRAFLRFPFGPALFVERRPMPLFGLFHGPLHLLGHHRFLRPIAFRRERFQFERVTALHPVELSLPVRSLKVRFVIVRPAGEKGRPQEPQHKHGAARTTAATR